MGFGAALPLCGLWMLVAWAVPTPSLAAVGCNSLSSSVQRRSGGNLLPPFPFPFPHSTGCGTRVMEIKGVPDF